MFDQLNEFQNIHTLKFNNFDDRLYNYLFNYLFKINKCKIIIDNLQITDLSFELYNDIYIHKQYYVKNLELNCMITKQQFTNILLQCDKDYLKGISLNNYNHEDIYMIIETINFHKLKNLHTIKFYDQIILNYNIKNLQLFFTLNTLYLHNCLRINTCIFHFILQNNKLKVLIIITTEYITQQISFSCLSRLLELTKLSITDQRLLDDHLIDFNNLNKLEELILNGCYQITNDGISNILKCSNLKSIIIHDSVNITSIGFELLWNSNTLNNICLSRIRNISIFLLFINCINTPTNLKIFEYDYQYERNNFNDVFNTYKNYLNYEITDIPNDYTFFHNELCCKFTNIKFIDLAKNNWIKKYRFNFEEQETSL